MEVEIDQDAAADCRRVLRFAGRGGPSPPLALDEGAVLADQQAQVRALFVGELEEDLFALGVFELLAVALEEAVRRRART